MVDVHTVSAGGGSIAWVDGGGALRVGPRSAGADPGPAAYGAGGTEPTVTDANLWLGYLADGAELGGEVVLRRELSEAALSTVAERIAMTVTDTALGVVAVANAEMVRALRVISVERGLDPRDFALVAFGGAGPQHAVGVAAELGIKRVIVPNHCSVLSAIGLLTADLKVFAAQTELVPIESLQDPDVQKIYEGLHRQALERLGAPEGAEVVSERFAGLRYVGQWHYVPLTFSPAETPSQLYQRFETQHEILYGTRIGTPVEIVDIGVTVVHPRRRELAVYLTKTDWDGHGDPSPGTRTMLLGGKAMPVPVYARTALSVDAELPGPCLVEELQTVTYIPAGSTGRVTREGYLVISLGEDD
jgi:N-methylhydantoinase A